LHPLIGEGGQVGLEHLIDAVIVEDAVVSPQTIVAKTDRVIRQNLKIQPAGPHGEAVP
jgi:hypothetical protein